MTNEQIKKEFCRWINTDRPKVWYKSKNVLEWTYTVGSPSWDVKATYIVDDEYAELRKAFYDGKTIQALYGKIWEDVKNPDWTGKVECYRIKLEEPVYEWRWYTYVELKNNVPYHLTNYHLTDEYYTNYPDDKHDWTKFEPSKRIRKG